MFACVGEFIVFPLMPRNSNLKFPTRNPHLGTMYRNSNRECFVVRKDMRTTTSSASYRWSDTNR